MDIVNGRVSTYVEYIMIPFIAHSVALPDIRPPTNSGGRRSGTPEQMYQTTGHELLLYDVPVVFS